MKNKPTLRLLALASLTVASVAPAAAQDAPYFYGGLSVGQTRASLDHDQIINTLTGLAPGSLSTDERSVGFKLFGGYQFNPWLAVEGGYFNLGKFGFDATVGPNTLHGRMKMQGMNLDLVATLPVTDRLSVLARAGAAYGKSRDDFSGNALAADSRLSEGRTRFKLGAGLQYAFSPSVLLRGEVERYRLPDAVGNRGHVNMVSVGLVFPFGRAPATMTQRTSYVAPAAMPAPAPAPVVVVVNTPPAPPPVVVAAVPAPAPVVAERRRVSFSADSLFAFDASAVRPDGKAALDGFAKELQGTRFDSITVEGHTDRLGSTAYNQTLSQQRADAVKAYLVTTDGLDAAKIASTGKGESTPATKPGDCKGNQPNAKLIACLQPDRRVEVEVVGTR